MRTPKIIQPVIDHVRSPITMRAIALFLALMFLTYTVISDYQQRQASFERYKAIVQYTEESRAALVAAKQQNDNFEASLKNSTATLVFMQEMAKSMQDVTGILQKHHHDHALLLNGRSANGRSAEKPKAEKKKKPRVRKCFEFIPKKKRIGANEITIYEGTDIPCD